MNKLDLEAIEGRLRVGDIIHSGGRDGEEVDYNIMAGDLRALIVAVRSEQAEAAKWEKVAEKLAEKNILCPAEFDGYPNVNPEYKFCDAKPTDEGTGCTGTTVKCNLKWATEETN